MHLHKMHILCIFGVTLHILHILHILTIFLYYLQFLSIWCINSALESFLSSFNVGPFLLYRLSDEKNEKALINWEVY